MGSPHETKSMWQSDDEVVTLGNSIYTQYFARLQLPKIRFEGPKCFGPISNYVSWKVNNFNDKSRRTDGDEDCIYYEDDPVLPLAKLVFVVSGDRWDNSLNFHIVFDPCHKSFFTSHKFLLHNCPDQPEHSATILSLNLPAIIVKKECCWCCKLLTWTYDARTNELMYRIRFELMFNESNE